MDFRTRPRQGRFYGALIILCLTVLTMRGADLSFAKDLPLLVELSKVGEAHDGKRITVFGWVRSAEVKRGRRGSLLLEIVVGEGAHSVFVYTAQLVANILDREVIVQGVYHERGRFAGLSAEHFIVAEAIVRDWPDTEGRH